MCRTTESGRSSCILALNLRRAFKVRTEASAFDFHFFPSHMHRLFSLISRRVARLSGISTGGCDMSPAKTDWAGKVDVLFPRSYPLSSYGLHIPLLRTASREYNRIHMDECYELREYSFPVIRCSITDSQIFNATRRKASVGTARRGEFSR